MEYNFDKAWLLALEQRFGMECTRIGDIKVPGKARMLVYYFADFPTKGMLTAVTGGLSNASHPSWVHGKPELMISLQTEDHGWAAVSLISPSPSITTRPSSTAPATSSISRCPATAP